MSGRPSVREVPLQIYSKIKLMHLPNALSNGKLFTDLSFPPDQSSLTYVYSGDDRYEKMVFKRPKDVFSNAVLSGVGGVYEAKFPWQSWRKSEWFEAAVAIVSLSVRHVDKLVVGYRNNEQSMQRDYIGAFHFQLWRFGEWIDVVVDDFLPTINSKFLYCPALGNPPEFWGALVEKAYAKCKKTYEAIENGYMLDALTDLTGAVCEFYTPDIKPPERLFHILYKSCVNRSLIVCWRNEKRLTPTGYKHTNVFAGQCGETEDTQNEDRWLHIVTATTKFPVADGRMIEMVRLKCPFQSEPKWNGKFAKNDDISWCSVNTAFIAKYKPLYNKDEDECWLTLDDFRCNFGGLIVCSSTVPYSADSLNLERCYMIGSEDERPFLNNSDINERSRMKSRHSVSNQFTIPKACEQTKEPMRQAKRLSITDGKRPLAQNKSQSEQRNSQEITVRENTTTVKVDNTVLSKHSAANINARTKPDIDGVVETGACRTPPLRCRYKFNEKRRSDHALRKDFKKHDRQQSSPTCKSFKTEGATHDKSRSGSISSSQSTFSTSDITVDIKGCSRDNSLKRPYSAPNFRNMTRRVSSGSLPNMTLHNFLATCSDHFQSHGSWRELLEYTGSWSKLQESVSRQDMKSHTRNPRIALPVLNPDAVNELLTPDLQGKAHVLISLIQDYRHGVYTGNSQLVPIGLCIYRCKNPVRDEKRSLSKLHLVGEIGPKEDVREVNGRFDLEPGNYFIVPYCLSEAHEGLYLVRVLAEKDPVAGKTGCAIA